MESPADLQGNDTFGSSSLERFCRSSNSGDLSRDDHLIGGIMIGETDNPDLVGDVRADLSYHLGCESQNRRHGTRALLARGKHQFPTPAHQSQGVRGRQGPCRHRCRVFTQRVPRHHTGSHSEFRQRQRNRHRMSQNGRLGVVGFGQQFEGAVEHDFGQGIIKCGIH